MAKITQLSTKGQVVIPSEMREALSLTEGDALQIEKVGDLIVIKKVALPSLQKELAKSKGGRR